MSSNRAAVSSNVGSITKPNDPPCASLELLEEIRKSVRCSNGYTAVHAATRRYTTHDADDSGGRQPPSLSLSLSASLSLSLSRARAIAPPGDDARAHPPIISHHHHQSPSSRARSARYFKRGCFVPPRRRARQHIHMRKQYARGHDASTSISVVSRALSAPASTPIHHIIPCHIPSHHRRPRPLSRRRTRPITTTTDARDP